MSDDNRDDRDESGAHPASDPPRPESRPREWIAETAELRCPHCLTVAIERTGQVRAEDGVLKVHYRCSRCDTHFAMLRLPWG